jgi:hypothetical protein
MDPPFNVEEMRLNKRKSPPIAGFQAIYKPRLR